MLQLIDSSEGSDNVFSKAVFTSKNITKQGLPMTRYESRHSHVMLSYFNLVFSIQYSVYSHLFSQIMLNYNNGKTKKQRKSNYMCTRYYFEIVRSEEQSFRVGHYHSAVNNKRRLFTEYT